MTAHEVGEKAPNCPECGEPMDSLLLREDDGREWWGCSSCEIIRKRKVEV